jgi:hypothetical protein
MTLGQTLDRLIARGGLTIPIVLALIGAAALAGAFVTTATSPAEPSVDPVEPEPVNVQSFSTGVDTSATVTNGTALYEEGEQLDDMPVYFFDSTPNVTFHVHTSATRADGPPPDATVTHRLALVIFGERDGQTFFESQRVVAAGKGQVTDGDPYWTNATVNVSAVRQDVREKRSAIGVAGRLHVRLILNVSYANSDYDGSLNTSTPLVVTDRSYWLDGTLDTSETEQTIPETTATPAPDADSSGGSGADENDGGLSLSGSTIGLAGFGLLCLLAAGLVGYRYQQIDHRALRAEIARSRYDEWISRGEIPTKSEKEYIRTDSLEDLVDIAIDSSKRVIHDVELDAYAVVEGDLVYYYSPTQSDVTDWFDL